MERQTVIDNDAEAAVRQMTVRAVDAENDRATIDDIRALMGQKEGWRIKCKESKEASKEASFCA